MSPALSPSTETRALLLGLDSTLTRDLKNALHGSPTVSAPHLPLTRDTVAHQIMLHSPDIIFCPSTPATLHLVLQAAQTAEVPVVVVSRLPHSNEWLDAMDAGAADYLAPPFDAHQLRWILDSNCRAAAQRA